MAGIAYLILRPRGLWLALGAGAVFAWLVAALVVYKDRGWGTESIPWVMGGLSLILVFGVAPDILRMALQALWRRILNQHVMLEIGAFAGISGGLIGLVLPSPAILRQPSSQWP